MTKQVETAQALKFLKAARDLGTDEDEAHFDATLKRVASAPPPKDPIKPKKKPAG